MKLNRIRNLLGRGAKMPAYDFNALLEEVRRVRKISEDLVIVPKPTGGNWLGINIATRQLFGSMVVELPQHYSSQLLTDEELESLSKEILALKFRNVVFSSLPLYADKMIARLYTATQVSTVIHGTFSEAGVGGKISESIHLSLQLLQQGHIQKIAAVRKDVTDFVSRMWGREAYTLGNKCVIPENIKPSALAPAGCSIGVFGTENFNKNIHNQVAGAALIKESTVYVTQPQLYQYLPGATIRGIERGDRSKFLSVLAAMDVNLHLSFSESWGQLAAESLALGVPCLVSATTNLLDDDAWLKEKLTVNRIDAPVIIAEKLESVIKDKEETGKRGNAYVAALNQKADKLLADFLNA